MKQTSMLIFLQTSELYETYIDFHNPNFQVGEKLKRKVHGFSPEFYHG